MMFLSIVTVTHSLAGVVGELALLVIAIGVLFFLVGSPRGKSLIITGFIGAVLGGVLATNDFSTLKGDFGNLGAGLVGIFSDITKAFSS